MARFNYDSQCAHPIVCKRLMTNFLQELTSIPIEIREGAYCYIYYNDFNEKILVYYFFGELMTLGVKLFRQDISTRANYTKGFSMITLMLLHELGHYKTKEDFDEKYYDTKSKALHDLGLLYENNIITQKELQFAYFDFPDEFAATQWAINWLTVKENRQKAKEFEKKFFKAWRGK